MADDLPTVSTDVYEIEGEVATGGLGRVLRARHRAMDRTVAVKVLLSGDAGEARFVREALVTGRLEHPSIVPVYDAGRWPSGEPFYTMKLLSGRTLLAVIRTAGTLAARLALLPTVIAVAEAIAYAHSRRVVHRDIKPANVIVGDFGETVVIDWGVARELDASAEQVEDGVAGTPAYMAPEQARGEVVDERADVYSLGALLYHVLAGAPPYDRPGADAESRDPTKVVVTPETPDTDETSRLLAEVALAAPPPLEARQPDVPTELAAIVHKAMARDPAQRYPTAREVAEELRRYQTGRLVSAHHYTPWQLTRRFVQRYRAAFVVAAAAVLALTSLGLVSVGRIVRAGRVAELRRDEAEEARHRAEGRERELILQRARALVDTDPTSALAALKQYPLDAPHWDEARRIAARAVGRGVALDLLRGHQGTVRALAFSPDGKTLASAGVDRTIRLWDVARARPPVLLQGHTGIVTDVAFSPDGTQLVSTGFDRRALLWDLAAGSARPIGEHDDGVRAVAFSRDGKTIATAGFNRRLILWSLAGERLKVLEGHLDSPLLVDFSPDGNLLFSAAPDDTIRLWDLRTGAARILPNRSWAAFSRDGNNVAAGFDGEVRVHDLAAGTSRSIKVPGLARPYAFSPDGKTLVVTVIDTVRLVDIASGRMRTLSGHSSDVYDAAFTPDGALLATAGLDGTIRIWAMSRPEGTVLHGLDGGAERVAFAPDGHSLAAAGRGGLAVWSLSAAAETRAPALSGAAGGAFFAPEDAKTGPGRRPREQPRQPRRLPDAAGAVKDLLYLAGGRTLLTAAADRRVRVWELATGTVRTLATTTYLPRPLAVAAGAPLVALADGFETLRVLSTEDGSERCRLEGKNLVSARFTADERRLVLGNGERLVQLDLDGCAETPLAEHGGGWITDLALAGDRLAYATKFGGLGLVDLDRAALRGLADDAYETRSVALSSDGSLLAAGTDLRISLWDTARGARVRELSGHDSPIEWLGFTPDGDTIVSRSADELRIWQVRGEGDRVYRGHDGRITAAAISPDGTRVASASADGTVRLWPVQTGDGLPTDARGLRAWLDGVTHVTLDERDRAASPVPASP